MLAAAALAENDDLEFVYLFGGFQHKFKELLILTLLYFWCCCWWCLCLWL